MDEGRGFIDYYQLMQVYPDCEAKTLELAYRHLAKMYHPDHPETADLGKFTELTEAYRILRDPVRRAEYDRTYFARNGHAPSPFPAGSPVLDEKTAINDADVHEALLLSLYRRRREKPGDPGLGNWLLQEMLDCSDENFEFHTWYLKSKGFIEVTEQGTLAITIDGVDHVIATSRSHQAQQLLISARTGQDHPGDGTGTGDRPGDDPIRH